MKSFSVVFLAAAWLYDEPGRGGVDAAKLTLGLGSRLGAHLSVDMLTPSGLQGIENSLIEMSQAGTATPGLQPFLEQIWDLTYMMQDQIRNQSSSSQTSLTQAWEEFLKCRWDSDTPVHTVVLDPLNRSHITCRHSESKAYEDEESCWEQTGILNLSVKVRRENFDIYDKDWPQNCVYPEPFPDPEQSSQPYLQQLRDNFASLFAGWNSSYWAWNASVEARDSKVEECHELRRFHDAQTQECDGKQSDLERGACGDGGEVCDKYIDCYTCKHKAWEAANTSAASAESTYLQEWRGILRIQCLLTAFNESEKEGGTPLEDGIDICRNTDFTGLQYNKDIRIEYHPFENEEVPDMVKCNDTSMKFNISNPGTAEWITTYYSNMPSNTAAAVCNAPCCESEVGCCYNYGFGANMVPCCLNTEPLDEKTCLRSTSAVGGSIGWAATCPENADVAYAMQQDDGATSTTAAEVLVGR
eukprot:gb/GFBE01065047.1/.p1 GENE.gb/GFBE01065047.1/~~gb/GFBE01065047.1/.p1  ORF type:complete len:471 (+),score=106.02 gb/GFBE01065047.1/:1-1413(+)